MCAQSLLVICASDTECTFVTVSCQLLGNVQSVDVSYHGERHAVNLMFVFGLVLSEGTVPEQEREREIYTVTGDFREEKKKPGKGGLR